MSTDPTPAERGLPELPASFGDHCVSDSVRTMREPGYTAGQMRDYGRACYEATLSSRPLPSDWVAVPREPTREMIVSCLSVVDLSQSDPEDHRYDDGHSDAKAIYRAMLAAAPSAPAEAVQTAPEPLAQGVCHQPCTPIDFFNGNACPECVQRDYSPKHNPPQPSASVGERARQLLAKEYRSHGWHEDAGRLCMGGDVTSFVEDDALRVIDRLIEEGDEDTHVINEMGRLLAAIAITLKGPEPAGTAWSYHDLPELVKSAVENAHEIASEMRAWAAFKMRERGSSRRDKMMVEEWSKRLFQLSETVFPVKDFEIPGLSLTKEEIRLAVRKVIGDRIFIGQDFGNDPPQPPADAEAVASGFIAKWSWQILTRLHHEFEADVKALAQSAGGGE